MTESEPKPKIKTIKQLEKTSQADTTLAVIENSPVESRRILKKIRDRCPPTKK